MKPESKLKSVLSENRDVLYSHAYVSCGYLTGKKNVFEEFIQPPNNTAEIFDISSLTKALVTTPLVIHALNQQGLSETATIAQFLGETSHPNVTQPLGQMAIKNLLLHRSGFRYWANFFSWCSDGHKQTLWECFQKQPQPLKSHETLYSDLNFLLLGEVLKIKEGGNFSLGEKALNLVSVSRNDVRWYDGAYLGKECIPTGFSPLRNKVVCGYPHDDNAFDLGGNVGHAGLFASGPGLVAVVEKLIASPVGKAILARNKKLLVDELNTTRLYGFGRGNDESSVAFCRGNTMGHYGFTGCAFWLDMDSLAYVVLLTNRVAKSYRIQQEWKGFRRDVFSLADQLIHGFGQ